MSIKNKNAVPVKQFTAAEEDKKLNDQLAKLKQERALKCMEIISNACSEYNCNIISQTIITGDKIENKISVVPN